MYSFRRFGPNLTALALIVLSGLAVVSVVEGLKSLLSKDRLRPYTTDLNQNGERSHHAKFPRSRYDDAENFKATNVTAVSSTLNPTHATSLVTVTVCSSDDSTPTFPPLALNTIPSISTDVLEDGFTIGGSKRSLSRSLLNPLPTTAGLPVTCVSILAVPAGYSCQPSLQTPDPYPAFCAPYVSNVYTVTQTFHSTDYDCLTMQTSYIAAFTVTVTVSANLTPGLLNDTNRSLSTSLPGSSAILTGNTITPSLRTSLLASSAGEPSFLLETSSSILAGGSSPSSLIVCPDGSSVERKQQCISSTTSSFVGVPSALLFSPIATPLNIPAAGPTTSVSRSAAFILPQKSPDSLKVGNPTGQASPPTVSSSTGAPSEGTTFDSITTIVQTAFRTPSTGTIIGSGAPANTATDGVAFGAISNTVSNSKSTSSVVLASASTTTTTLSTGDISNPNSASNGILPSGPPESSPINSVVNDAKLGSSINLLASPSAHDSASNIASDLKSIASGAASSATSIRGVDSIAISGANLITGLRAGIVTSTPQFTPNVIDSTGPLASKVLPPGSAFEESLHSISNSAGPSIDNLLPIRTATQEFTPSFPNGTQPARAIVVSSATSLQSLISDIVGVSTSTTGAKPTPSLVQSSFPAVNSVLSGFLSPSTAIPSLVPSIKTQGLELVSTTGGVLPLVSAVVLISQNASSGDSILGLTTTSQIAVTSAVSQQLELASTAGGILPPISTVRPISLNATSVISSILSSATAPQGVVPSLGSQGLGVVSTPENISTLSTAASISRNVSSVGPVLVAISVLVDDVSAISSVAAVLPEAVSAIEDAVPAISSIAAALPGVVSNISKFIANLPTASDVLKYARPSATSISSPLAPIISVPSQIGDVMASVRGSTTNARVITQVTSTATIFVPKSESQRAR